MTTTATRSEVDLPVMPPTDLPDPDLTENALTVLERRYLVKDDEMRPVETPRELFWRVARTIASVDLHYGASGAEAQVSAERFARIAAINQPRFGGKARPQEISDSLAE